MIPYERLYDFNMKLETSNAFSLIQIYITFPELFAVVIADLKSDVLYDDAALGNETVNICKCSC